jgi:hypothetical protein
MACPTTCRRWKTSRRRGLFNGIVVLIPGAVLIGCADYKSVPRESDAAPKEISRVGVGRFEVVALNDVSQISLTAQT